jgi:hypothetical protein
MAFNSCNVNPGSGLGHGIGAIEYGRDHGYFEIQ